MHHKEIHTSDGKSRSKGKPCWEKVNGQWKIKKKTVSKTAQDQSQKIWFVFEDMMNALVLSE